jgi:hypothetical protein
MSNPRVAPEFSGIRQLRATYIVDDVLLAFSKTATGGNQYAGRAVKVSGHRKVALAADNDRVHGRVEAVEPDGRCVVTVRGYVTFPGGNSATLTEGRPVLGALDGSSVAGCVKTGTTAGTANGEIIDNTDTANVIVLL